MTTGQDAQPLDLDAIEGHARDVRNDQAVHHDDPRADRLAADVIHLCRRLRAALSAPSVPEALPTDAMVEAARLVMRSDTSPPEWTLADIVADEGRQKARAIVSAALAAAPAPTRQDAQPPMPPCPIRNCPVPHNPQGYHGDPRPSAAPAPTRQEALDAVSRALAAQEAFLGELQGIAARLAATPARQDGERTAAARHHDKHGGYLIGSEGDGSRKAPPSGPPVGTG